jgi:hypothetical protein
MCLGRNRYNRFLLAGNFFLLPAALWSTFLRHHPQFPDGLGDGVMGLLYGLTIGSFILGLIKARRGEA